MTGRSNWEYKNQPQLSATERLKRALERPVNEAIKVEPKKAVVSDTPSKLNSAVLGTGGAAKAARAIKKGTTESID
jgi:hypothetical protein